MLASKGDDPVQTEDRTKTDGLIQNPTSLNLRGDRAGIELA